MRKKGTEILYCAECARRLTGKDFQTGQAYEDAGHVYCASCGPAREDAPRTPPPPTTPRAAAVPGTTRRASATPSPGLSPLWKLLAVGVPGLLLLGVVIVFLAKSPEGPAPVAEEPPVPKPAAARPSGPSPEEGARSALHAAQEHLRTRPDDFAGAKRLLEKLVAEAPGTIAAAEARLELERLPAREAERAREKLKAVEGDLVALDAKIAPLLEKEEYPSALKALEEARRSSDHPAWLAGIEKRTEAVVQSRQDGYAKVRDQALAAARRGAGGEAEALVGRVGRWGDAGLADDLKKLIARIKSEPPLVVFDDALARGWKNWSWGSAVVLDHAAAAHSGRRAISVTVQSGWGGLYLRSDAAIEGSKYVALSFAARATRKGQRACVYLANEEGKPAGRDLPFSELGGEPPADAWRRYVVPFERFGAAAANVYGIVIMDLTGEAQPPMLLDDIALLPTLPPPAGSR